MRKIVFVAVFAAAAVLHAAVPQYRVDLDSQHTDREWDIKWIFQAATPLVRANLYQDSSPWTPTADWGGFLWYGTNANWAGGAIVKIAGSFDTNNAYADFQSTSNQFAQSGVFYGGFVMTNGTQTIEWGLGTLYVRTSGGIGATGTLVTTTPINWTLYSYANTADDGPYRAGAGIEFSATNNDGSVTISTQSDGDDTQHGQTNIVGLAKTNVFESAFSATPYVALIFAQSIGQIATIEVTSKSASQFVYQFRAGNGLVTNGWAVDWIAKLNDHFAGTATVTGLQTVVDYPAAFAIAPYPVATFAESIGEIATIEIPAYTASNFTFQVRGGAGLTTNAWTIDWLVEQ